jgi:hypothetical protein
MSVNESKIAERQRIDTTAFYIAEAGLERGLYDLRQDFSTNNPSWSDGNINGMAIGPNTASYYTVPYASTNFNGGSYTVQFKNMASGDIWVKSVGTLNGVSYTLLVYAKIVDLSPWSNAIYAGAGASGSVINGNVDIRGSVTILGNGLAAGDYAIDLGGTAQLVGNNYTGIKASLSAKIPALPIVSYNGENVSSLQSVLRVKKGMVGVSGSATVGEPNVAGNSVKETVDAVYVTDGWGGNQGTAGVYSDNGSSNAYDLGNTASFPNLSDPYAGYSSYTQYFQNGALTINDNVNLTPGTNVTYTDGTNTLSVDGSGNMTVAGKVYINGTLSMAKSGSNATLTYTGKGSVMTSGNVQIDINLVTAGNSSFPNNAMGIMTPGNIGFNGANIDVMGVFYAQNTITAQKQTNIVGSLVSNYLDMGTNVPAVYQVPTLATAMPAGMIGQDSKWYMIVAWIKS